jgi:ATP-dependent helicase/nuclease subunit A
MSAMSEPTLPFDDEPVGLKPATADVEPVQLRPATSGVARPAREFPDQDARAFAVDPTRNVVLEASAGTGKTRVLVERYVNLLRAGVEPDHILAITFTRKAAAEMRQRIVDRLKEASRASEFDAARWRDMKERLGDIAVSTIDAFCLQLLREFPLEADVDPGFDLADNTEVPRLVGESLDQALRICRGIARENDEVALVFAQLGERRLRSGIAALLDRRLVAAHALRRFLQKGPRDLTAATACESAAARLRETFAGVRGGFDSFLIDGPRHHPQFAMLAADVRVMVGGPERPALRADAARQPDVARPFQGREEQAAFRALIDRLRAYFLTQEGKPRSEKFAGTGFTAGHCDSPDAWKRHRTAASEIAPAVHEAIRAFRRDLNAVMSRGVWRIFAIAMQQYRHTLESHALLDFSGVLERAVQLLKDMDEFAESRLRLEARHRHVLVDEFQDTSRAQWELVRQLVKSWGEGFGVADDAIPPSIFIVGDRKQSIYGFRDADVAMVDEAAMFIDALRPGGAPKQAITVSFRSAPEILAFVNDVFAAIVDGDASAGARRDAFRYGDHDRFPVDVDPSVRLKPDATDATAPAASDATPPDTTDAVGRDPSGVRLQPDLVDRAVRFIVGDTVQAAADAVADEIVRLVSGATVRDRTTGVAREAGAADIAILFRSRDSHRDFEAALDRRGVSAYVYKGLGFFDADEIQDAVALLRYLADPLSDLRAATLLRSRIVRLSDDAVARLGQRSADAILSVDPLPELAQLGDEDRRVLELLRHAVPRWLRWVDRLAPSELLDAVLHESAYAFELRGSRRRQARENVKKLRGMIRRSQNRGYATLARIADHLERLAVGDESNAAIDAIDAVSLMTVHAAKGLEFPIVFVVNMGRGTGGVRAPIRVTDDAAGEPSVAIADYQSEADEDVTAREREETKRLLYVAITRARDRLFLSATVKDGACRMGRGGLGDVLPAGVRTRFIAAAAERSAASAPSLVKPSADPAPLDDFGAL